jgi:hypothetical protein
MNYEDRWYCFRECIQQAMQTMYPNLAVCRLLSGGDDQMLVCAYHGRFDNEEDGLACDGTADGL